jgi:O-antigen/teichoic acid export membrane protein
LIAKPLSSCLDTANDNPNTAKEARDALLARMVRNSVFNGIGAVLIVPFNFFALFTLARRLGADSLGTFFTLFAISAVIHWVADAGTTTVLTRRVAREPNKLGTLVPEAAGVLLGVCTISALLFFSVAIPWMALKGDGISLSVLVVAALAMASRHALDFAAHVFRGLERFEFENLARVAQTGLFCLFVWFCVYADTGGTLAAFVAYAVSNWIAALLLWAYLIRSERCGGFRFTPAMLKSWWRASLPLGVGDVIRQVLLQMDTLMLAAFRPSAVVGLFSIAARPLQPLQLVPRIIVSVTFPSMSRSGHLDRSTVSRTFAQTTTLLWAASLPVSIVITICAEPLIRKTAGMDFLGAVGPLQALIWSTGLIFVNAQLRLVLTALDEERRYWRLIGWILAAKVALGVVLIPAWGIYGGCLANLLAEAALCAAGLVVLRKLGIAGPAWSQLLRLAIPAVIMAGVLTLMVSSRDSLVHLAIDGVLAGIVYIGTCLVCGVWPREDLTRLYSAVRRTRQRKRSEQLALASAEVVEGAAS